MTPKKAQPELIDIVADAIGHDITDREAFTKTVNDILVSFIVPRLYRTELEQRGVISPKKAPSDARAAREVPQ